MEKKIPEIKPEPMEVEQETYQEAEDFHQKYPDILELNKVEEPKRHSTELPSNSFNDFPKPSPRHSVGINDSTP